MTSQQNDLISTFRSFFKTEAAGGVLLLLFAVLALVWANSPWADSYFGLWKTYVTAGIGSQEISKPLLLWVNDGLMAIFFSWLALK